MARTSKPLDPEVEKATSEEGAAPVAPVADGEKKYEPAWSGIGQNLTDADLENVPIRKMLVNELARLTQEVRSLEAFREQFYAADKKNGILEERAGHAKTFNIANALTAAVGSICSGVGTNQLFASVQPHEDGGIVLAGGTMTGLALIVIGIACIFVPIIALATRR